MQRPRDLWLQNPCKYPNVQALNRILDVDPTHRRLAMSESEFPIQLKASASAGSAGNGQERAERAERIARLQDLLSTHRQRLSLLSRQKAALGVQTDPHIQMDIDWARSEIKRIKQELRELGESVEDWYDDDSDQRSDDTTGPDEICFLLDKEYIEKTSAVYVAPPIGAIRFGRGGARSPAQATPDHA